MIDNKISDNKFYTLLIPVILFLSDYAAVVVAEHIAVNIRNYFVTDNYLKITPFMMYFVIPFFYLCGMFLKQTYMNRIQFWKVLERCFAAVFYGTAAIIVVLYFVKEAGNTSRFFILLNGVFVFILVIFFRYIMKRILCHFDIFRIPILIIGGGKTAEVLVKGIKDNYGEMYKIIGILEDYERNEELRQYPVLGGFRDAERIIKERAINNVVIAAPGLAQSDIISLVNRVQPLVHNLSIVPNLIAIPMSGIKAERFFNEKIMLLRLKNNLASPLNRWIKYTFDFICTLIGTVIISPLLLLIAAWIYFDSPGPVIFRHVRIGKNGREFGCYKFRTMCMDADKKLAELLANDAAARAEWERDFKLKNDPRVTKVGKFLRKTSLDELPQIFNVLKGEMSLVGPRPVVEAELEKYGEYLDDYFMVRPGITGMWQVNGRSDTTYEERVHMDSWYVRNWSIWIDIMLLWRTVKSVIKCEGAY